MARTRKRLVYFEPQIDAQVEERCAELGLSVNEWLNRLVAHGLASKKRTLKVSTTYEVQL